VLQAGAISRPYQVDKTAELSKADFTLNAKVTRLTLNSNDGFDKFLIRHTSVYAQSEELKLARRPLDKAVSGAVIDLNGVVGGLCKDQKVIVGGKLYPSGQEIVYETGIIDQIAELPGPETYTRITLKNKLEHSYQRPTVTINANVVLATHGERVREILGSGDAAQGFQTFALRHAPLTYVSSSKPGGAQSTLEVRVNDLLWEEVPSLFGHGPNERIYRTFSDDQGKTMVQFGDGATGARLPSGRENVVASYRKGLGLEGLVKPKQLSLLMNQPLGVKGVTNPLAADGADDPEKLEDARQNAPLTVLTLDRVVSLKDYEDYTRAFGGLAKALATWFWNGQERGILLSVAAPRGNPVLQGTQVYDNLVNSLKLAGDPFLPVWVASYQPRTFKIAAKVKVDPGLITEKIIKDVETTLRAHFSFEARNFGQSVALSEVMAVIQKVAGVLAVDVDALHYSDAPPSPQPATRLTASLPRLGSANTILAAELLTLEPAPLALGVMP
jgi:predicted phage baseplate assembly protein